MKETEAETLRIEWSKLGHPPCTHKALILQETNTGYLTGAYICVRCGEEVVRRKPNR
jgi:hypothetical protein